MNDTIAERKWWCRRQSRTLHLRERGGIRRPFFSARLESLQAGLFSFLTAMPIKLLYLQSVNEHDMALKESRP
ncbi:hypothetical protein K1719_017984 [Acacia pycnantha]|nr:hypothetical protein K1719_017984 [Acacia pycnantha]